jgi:ATP-dependent Clp protease ATP-binding subunit ClpX
MEKIMLDIMYDIPSRQDVKKVMLTQETIDEGAEPQMVLQERKAKKREETAS